MKKTDVQKLVFQAYNLSTQDPKPRGRKSLIRWFNKEYHKDDRPAVLVSPRKIETVVSEYYNFSVYKIYKKGREQPRTLYRHIIQYLMRKYTLLCDTEIGKRTGGFDRTTVVNSKHVMDHYDTSKLFREQINEIEERL